MYKNTKETTVFKYILIIALMVSTVWGKTGETINNEMGCATQNVSQGDTKMFFCPSLPNYPNNATLERSLVSVNFDT